MKKFEYYSFFATTQDEIDRTLDKLGALGWEVYAILPNGRATIVYLKREKPNE